MKKPVAIVPEKDEALVARALSGDKAAFGQLVSRYEKRVFSLVYEMVKQRQDAEDITQEVFVRVYFSLKNFRAESSFYTWLYRIAYNMTIDFKRRAGRRPQDALAISGNEDADKSNNDLVSNVQLPDEVIDNQERQVSIRAALAEISEEHRAVIILREVDGLSYDEISKVTGSARGTVMSRLHYARKHLQRVLKSLRFDADSDSANSDQSLTHPGSANMAESTESDKAAKVDNHGKGWKLSSLLKRENVAVAVNLNRSEFDFDPKGAKI